MARYPIARALAASTVALLTSIQVVAGQLRPITVQDCVRTRRVMDQEVQISPDGSQVAYVVKAPDIVSNRNDYRLYVRDLAQLRERENGRLLLHADSISEIRWLGPQKIIVRVEKKADNSDDSKGQLTVVDTTTGQLKALKVPYQIQLYSSSADGDTIVFSARAQTDISAESEQSVQNDEARGFRVLFGSGVGDSYEHLPEFDVYLGKRTKEGELDIRKLCFREPAESSMCSPLRNIIRLNLSPDGKRLLVTYSSRVAPPGWTNQTFIKHAKGVGTLLDTYVLSLYDIETGQLHLAFNYPGALLHASWSDNSEHYSVVGPSPFGTKDASAEAEAAMASGQALYYMNRFQHVFIVEVRTGVATNVRHREGGEPGNFKFWNDPPLFRTRGDDLLVRISDHALAWMTVQNGKWEQRGLVDLRAASGSISSLTGNDRVLVGVTQTTITPPDLFIFDLRRNEIALLTDLNPEYSDIRLGQTERIEWTNRFGSRCAGLMIKPVGFEAGKRYPMIFLAANTTDDFISDAPYLTTAYAPQSLASAGFIVLIAHYPADDKTPKGEFPGEMSAAYNWMSMVEAGVNLLVDRKLVDPNRVGIGGFSRTSWLTDFVVTHSTYKFIAASSADSGIYNYGMYFRYNSLEDMKGDETQLGGPPYGETLANWLRYAPPFNAKQVGSAVLMEYTGVAEHGFEFFTALSRLGKPVEFYRYPKGKHPLDTPFERLASLQRNIDWFRFWLQGYERPEPEDSEQYARWREMRARRDAAANN